MRSSLTRFLAIGLGSLIIGLLANAANPAGIRYDDLFPPASTPKIAVDEAFHRLAEPTTIFLDIRPINEYRIDHIPKAVSFHPASAVRRLKPPRTDSLMLIVYDFEAESIEARKAAGMIRRAGFTRVFLLEGGFAAWLDRGLPVAEGRIR